jgi:hypothetical protein
MEMHVSLFLDKMHTCVSLSKEPNATFEVYGQEVAFGANSSVSSKQVVYHEFRGKYKNTGVSKFHPPLLMLRGPFELLLELKAFKR